MKNMIAALTLMLTMSATTVPAAAQHHRHHARTEAAALVKETQKADEGVDAYSDTASIAGAPDTVASTTTTTIVQSPASPHYQDDDIDDDIVDEFFKKLLSGTLGVGAGIFALVIVVLVFLFLLAPFIIAAIAIWYAYKRRRNRDRLVQTAIENGQPIPQDTMKQVVDESDEELWKKGIKNIFLGIGLALMFWILGAEELAGIGLLITCIGAGQAFIAKHNQHASHNGNQNNTASDESL